MRGFSVVYVARSSDALYADITFDETETTLDDAEPTP
jgi:hypothetical protein